MSCDELVTKGRNGRTCAIHSTTWVLVHWYVQVFRPKRRRGEAVF